MNPSNNTKPLKNGTFVKLNEWMKAVNVPHWDFHNVVPTKTGDVKMDDVDWNLLGKKCEGRKVIICLGVFVRSVVEKATILHARIIRIDHPSSRNRNFNDPAYEPQMLARLRKELTA